MIAAIPRLTAFVFKILKGLGEMKEKEAKGSSSE